MNTQVQEALGAAHTALTEQDVAEGVFQLMLALTDALSGRKIDWEDYSVLKRRILAAANHHSFMEGR